MLCSKVKNFFGQGRKLLLDAYREMKTGHRTWVANYILPVFLLSFITTRIILYLRDIKAIARPQFWAGGYHIHHYWYGIIMILIASGMVLLFEGENILKLSCIIFGVGLGVFADEIGLLLTDGEEYWVKVTYYIVVVMVAILILFVSLIRTLRFTYHAEGIDLNGLLDDVASSFVNQGFKITDRKATDDSYLLKVERTGIIRAIVGAVNIVTIELKGTPDDFSVKIEVDPFTKQSIKGFAAGAIAAGPVGVSAQYGIGFINAKRFERDTWQLVKELIKSKSQKEGQ